MEIRAIRRRKLEELIAEAKGVATLSMKTGVSEKYLRQIITGFRGSKDRQPRSIGHDVARRLESGMKKPPGWMDSAQVIPGEHSAPPLSDEALLVARMWDTLPPQIRENLLAVIEFSASAAKLQEPTNRIE